MEVAFQTVFIIRHLWWVAVGGTHNSGEGRLDIERRRDDNGKKSVSNPLNPCSLSTLKREKSAFIRLIRLIRVAITLRMREAQIPKTKKPTA